MFITSNKSSDADDVESMAMNLAFEDVPKIIIKKKKMKRKRNIKIRSLRNGSYKKLKKQKKQLTEMEMSWCYVL